MTKNLSFKHLGVRKRLLLILILVALLLTGCYTYIFSTLNRQAYARVDTSAYQTASALIEQTAAKIDALDKVTSYLLQEHYQNDGNHSIFPFLNHYDTSEEDSAALSKAFTSVTRKLFYLFPSLEGLYLYSTDGQPVIFDSRDFTRLTTPSLTDADWRSGVLDMKGEFLLLHVGQIPHGLDQAAKDIHYLYGVRALINLRSSFSPSCLAMAQIDIREIDSAFLRQHSYLGQSYALLDRDYNVLASDSGFPMQSFFRESLAPGDGNHPKTAYRYSRFSREGSFFHLVSGETAGIICVVSTPTSVISYAPFFIILLSLLLVLFMTVLFVQFTFRGISAPIGNLIEACARMGCGDFSTRLIPPPDAELGYLTESFNQMAQKVETLINTVYLKDIAERDLELQMLRNQINPHFLYNTLESMRMASYTEGYHDLSQMCQLLADVLRYGVSSPTELVTLKEELSHLEEYITLSQYRFHYAVNVNIMISHDLYTYLSLKLIFQPLVENAFNHGFKGFTGQERVDVFGYEKEGILYFQVTDNGGGMTPLQTETLNGYIRGENDLFSSIGLKNVHRRIVLYYGTEYGLSIVSQEGRGTSVHIRIPALLPDEGGTTHV